MFHELALVEGRRQVASNVFTLELKCASIAHSVLPGQFLNIRPGNSFDPFLRRAYSVHRVDGDQLEIIFNVVGSGSGILAAKRPGEYIDILGPLGVPFSYDGDYSTAILVSGGVGIAPMPILGDAIARSGRHVVNVHGARSRNLIADDGRLMNVTYATDDGSLGIHGTVVDALDAFIRTGLPGGAVRLFACGPNRMLEALGEYAAARSLRLDVSLECQMACGVGICQGCPVQMASTELRYSLVCTHGPNYNINDILLSSLPSLH